MHHLSSEDVAAYLDGECTESERIHAVSHLETCEPCRQEVEAQQFTKALLRSLGDANVPRSFAISPEMVSAPAPLSSPGSEAPSPANGSNLIRFEPITRLLSVAAVLAFLVLGGAQLAGFGGDSDSNNQSLELSETDTGNGALQEQEPALARGELREQGESAAANAAPLSSEVNVDTQTQVTDSGLTLLETTTIGVGLVALASIAAWILIHYRAGAAGSNS